jgi:hypothetical protein
MTLPSENKNSKREMDKAVEMVYRDTLENIAFQKRQQISITNYVFIGYGAIIAISRLKSPSGKAPFEPAILEVLAILAMIIGIFGIWSTQSGIRKFRDRLGVIYENWFTSWEQDALQLKHRGDLVPTDFYPWLTALIFLGAFVVMAVVRA